MRKRVVIGSTAFRTKKSAVERIREALYRYAPGRAVTDPTDIDLLAALVLMHPEADQKIGCGIAGFEVRKNDGSVGFWLVRTDGTATDFSFYSCLTPPTHSQNLRRALRAEVRDQIQAFKSNVLSTASPKCSVTGEALSKVDCHVDHHDPTFEQLVFWFLKMCELAEVDLQVNETKDGSTETVLLDREWAGYWSEFHRQRAQLRCVTRRANLSLLRRCQ